MNELIDVNELIDFLKARLDEDEADARANRGTYPSAVAWQDGRVALHAHEDGSAVIVRLGRPVECPGDLIALKRWTVPVAEGWTASRVLREVEAKRALLADLLAEPHLLNNREWYGCRAMAESESDVPDIPTGEACTCGRDANVERRIRILASAYAHHPDYQEAWKP